MITLVCGSRVWADTEFVRRELDALWAANSDLLIVEGGAKGADRAAGNWARDMQHKGVQWMHLPADWKNHDLGWCRDECWQGRRPYCVGAGPKRNQQMLEILLEGGDDITLVLAFKDDFNYELTYGGTEDMVRRAHERGIPYRVVSH